MKKLSLIFASLLSFPLVSAEECGLTNFFTCLPEKLAEYILYLFNAPIIPSLLLVEKFLSEPVAIEYFKSLWSIMIYVISLFYGLLFLFSGLNFIVSGYDAEKRANAKEWLKNTLMMVFFVQASFLIYSLCNDLSSLLASGVINLIDEKFFLITVENPVNLGLSLAYGFIYMMTIILTVVLLGLRYLLVASGVVFFPVGLFLYFIPPLRGFGRLILNVLGVLLMLPFILSLELLVASMLMSVPVFGDLKIMLMMSAFGLVNLTMLFMLIFALVKAAFSVLRSDVGQAGRMVYGHFK